MIYQQDITLPADLLEEIMAQGLDAIPEMIRILINLAMKIERQAYLGAGPYERTPERRDQANGYKPKTVATRMGAITFDIPQVRHKGFYPQALEKGLRSERALKVTLAEMYVQGVSTRKVAAVTEKLCGLEVSSAQACSERSRTCQPRRRRTGRATQSLAQPPPGALPLPVPGRPLSKGAGRRAGTGRGRPHRRRRQRGGSP